MTCNEDIRNFRKKNFLWDKDIVEWKIRSRGLVWHLTKSFLKKEGLNQKLNISEVVLNVSQTAIWERSPSRCAIFVMFGKKSYVDAIGSHFACVQTEVESRTRGSRPRPRTQKNPRPRPRTAFPRTEPFEAKDRNARGQGQGLRTHRKCSQKKKNLQKYFSGDLQFIGVPRILDWGRPKPQITCNDVIKIFLKRKFL